MQIDHLSRGPLKTSSLKHPCVLNRGPLNWPGRYSALVVCWALCAVRLQTLWDDDREKRGYRQCEATLSSLSLCVCVWYVSASVSVCVRLHSFCQCKKDIDTSSVAFNALRSSPAVDFRSEASPWVAVFQTLVCTAREDRNRVDVGQYVGLGGTP